VDDYHGVILKPRKNDAAFVFQPFICQQVLKTKNGLPWIGFVFVCEVAGKIKMNKKEARNPQWVSMDELKTLLEKHPEKFFPLQLPVLKYFIEKFYEKI
jgi:isopentenyldiphosphate isomerase